MKKALVLSAAAAAIGLGAMNASAIPSGYQSVNFHATLNFQNHSSTKGYFITKVSASNKDLLYLINNEFGTVPSSGAQLVSYGLYYGYAYTEFFAVLNKNNGVVISDASTDAGSYELNFDFSTSSGWIQAYIPGTSDSYSYQSSAAQLVYSDYFNDNYFTLGGFAKDNVNWDNYNETYSMPSGTGYFYMPIANMTSIYDNYGVMTGSLGGSGKDVYPWDY